MTRVESIVLALVRSVLGEEVRLDASPEDDWAKVFEVASAQGLASITLDGIQACYTSNPALVASLDSPSNKALKYDWFGAGLSSEIAYENHLRTIADLAALYSKAGIRMMLLKGYGLSLNYPVPEHRPSGDIDVYLYGLGQKADEVIQIQTGVNVKQNEDKHSVFQFHGVTVENHESFVNAKVHPSLLRLDIILKSEAVNGIPLMLRTKDGEAVTIYLPSHVANALFVPIHCASHFVHGEALLRQVCDWACFVKRYGKEINWDFIRIEAQVAGFEKFFCCLNGIVEKHFGVPGEVLPDWPRYPKLQDKVLKEIFRQGPPKELHFIGKVFRFFASSWRYRLVFRESMLATFFRLSRSYRRFNDDSAESVWEG